MDVMLATVLGWLHAVFYFNTLGTREGQTLP